MPNAASNRFIFTSANALRGALIYAAGDTVAALLLQEFSLLRLLGMLVLGGTLYAFEIPNYFRWIDRTVNPGRGNYGSLIRALLALLYFNPLWIARHLLFIKLFNGQTDQINWGLLQTAGWSFLVNIPIALAANYIIQNKLPLSWRFTGSAIFSGLMAVYYALSAVWFK